MSEQTHVNVTFRGETYRITTEHAHMLAMRGHLIHRRFSGVKYEVENDRNIEVIGEPISPSRRDE